MGGLCNLFTGGGLPLRCSPCSHHRKPIIPPEWPELALSREFARRWVGCAIPLRGVDSRCDALPCPHQRKPIIPPEWPELVSSREFVRRWVGCAISLRGVDSCCDALLAHITTSPLSHPNGPNWLGAKNSPEDGWAVQFLYGGWTPAATLSLLTSPQVHYPTRMALELASSRKLARRWVGCATCLRGVDSRCDALLVHITASPLSHPNGPNWL